MAAPAEVTIATRVLAAAGQGAVGAMVGAGLSALAEPIVNRVLVRRVPLAEAMRTATWAQVVKMFGTTLPTNFVKFPFFEAVNLLMSTVDVNPAMRGTVTGAVFTSATLPITNYRFQKSMGNDSVDVSMLYQAYVPTVLRDIVYGIVRNNVSMMLMVRNPEFNKTDLGRVVNMFITVFASCVISAPGNEYRGFCLQKKGEEKPFVEFFKFQNFIRSTISGSIIMSTALACGAFFTPKMQALLTRFRDYLEKNPLAYCLIGLFVLSKMMEKLRDTTEEKKKSSHK